MPYRVRSGAGTGGGGSSCAPFVWSDSLARTDQPVFNLTQIDSLGRSDDLGRMTLTLDESPARTDAFVAGPISALFAEGGARNDVMTVQLVLPAVPRSGTPDSDMWGNCWTDHTVGNTTINHSNFAPAGENMQVSNTVANVGEKRAYVKANLTGITGFSRVAGGLHKFEFAGFNGTASGALAQSVTLDIYASAASPFTESTATDASPPTLGTFVNTFAFTIDPGTGYQAFTITLADTDVAAMLAKWVLFRWTRAPAVTEILSAGIAPRESTADSSTRKPKLTLTLTPT